MNSAAASASLARPSRFPESGLRLPGRSPDGVRVFLPPLGKRLRGTNSLRRFLNRDSETRLVCDQ